MINPNSLTSHLFTYPSNMSGIRDLFSFYPAATCIQKRLIVSISLDNGCSQKNSSPWVRNPNILNSNLLLIFFMVQYRSAHCHFTSSQELDTFSLRSSTLKKLMVKIQQKLRMSMSTCRNIYFNPPPVKGVKVKPWEKRTKKLDVDENSLSKGNSLVCRSCSAMLSIARTFGINF